MRNPWDELVDETGRPGLTLGEWAVVGAGGFALFLLASLAWAQEGVFSDQECQALARFARTSAEIRDIDANLDKHLALVRRRVAEGGMQLSKVIERELVRVYAEGLTPEAAEQSTHTRCMTGEILGKEG